MEHLTIDTIERESDDFDFCTSPNVLILIEINSFTNNIVHIFLY